MVDVIRSTGIEYIYANPASSYRGIHESLINYGGNTKPEFIECMHEESSIAMAHGYYKATGKLGAVLCHGTVGLMHGTMAIYNAWCDRAPVLVMGGNDLDASKRPPGVPTTHSAQDINAIVRDFTKWDDTPVSLQHFAQSFVRAAKFAMTPPHEPVMLTLDAEVQESPIKEHERNTLYIPKYAAAAPPQAEVGALREAAKLLVNAQSPVIVVDRVARTPAGVKHLIELAELLQVPIMDMNGRMNFPNTHHLQPGRPWPRQLVSQADVIFGMEMTDFWNTVNGFTDNADNEGLGTQQSKIKPGTKLITISSVELNQKSNYQDFQRFQSDDISMVGDAEASLPSLIEAVKMAMSNDKKADYEKRGSGEAMKKSPCDEGTTAPGAAAAVGWDTSPISTPARLTAEIWNAVKDEDWSLVASTGNVSGWPQRMFKFDKHYQWLGSSGGSGLGYQGARLPARPPRGNKSLGRFSVSIQGDGDPDAYAPGVLWTTCAHPWQHPAAPGGRCDAQQSRLPPGGHARPAPMSNRRNRVANNGKDFGPIGTKIQNPDIDFATLAKSMGVQGFGPVKDPSELGPTLAKAVQVVKAGEPALVDVVTQPR